MSNEEEIRELKNKYESLFSDINRLKNIAWVLGVLAGVFGIAGSFSIKSIIDLNKKIGESEAFFDSLQVVHQEKFSQYVEDTKDTTFGADLSSINRRISGIRLSVSNVREEKYGANQGRRTSTQNFEFMYGINIYQNASQSNVNHYKTLELIVPD